MVAVVLNLGLLAYAMYALLGVIVLSRMLADRWSAQSRGDARDQSRAGEDRRQRGGRHGARESQLAADSVAAARRPAAAEGAHSQPAESADHGPAAAAGVVPRPRRKTISYQLKCNCRGYYQLGPLVAETGDVFGLYRRYRVLSEPSFVLVYPEVVPLAGFDIASRRPIGEVRMSHRLFEDPTRIAGVRGYQAGDPLNRIHWRATARTGVLHSKIYEPSTVAGATILLDFHEQSFAARGRAGAVGAGGDGGGVDRRGALRRWGSKWACHQRPRCGRPDSPRGLDARATSHAPRGPGGRR